MQIQLQSAEICLSNNHLLSLHSASGQKITCTDGQLWITVSGEAEDIFLNTGEHYQVVSNGLTILECIGSGKFRLEKSAGFSGFRQLLAWTSKYKPRIWPTFNQGTLVRLRERL